MGGFLYTLDTPIIVMPIVLFIGKEEAALLLAEARQRVKIA
ncbi:hypothetical protein [Tenuibacillus multivorans]|nr:hypothetical protein [Tenuibacillus multivorans]